MPKEGHVVDLHLQLEKLLISFEIIKGDPFLSTVVIDQDVIIAARHVRFDV